MPSDPYQPPPQPNPARRILIALALGAMLVSSLPFLALGGIVLQDYWRERQRCQNYTQFSPTIWRDASLTLEPAHVRLCMVDNLLAQNLLLGKSRAEVVELLGQPEPQNGSSGYELVYLLGPERGFISIDYEWLVIQLDGAGQVSDARLMTD